jgi:hypothetical protein
MCGDARVGKSCAKGAGGKGAETTKKDRAANEILAARADPNGKKTRKRQTDPKKRNKTRMKKRPGKGKRTPKREITEETTNKQRSASDT